jgi:antirestriction protein ArdC
MPKFRSNIKTARSDHYQELTDKVVAALEAGTKPWQRPWDPEKAGGPSMPVNAATGRRYRGINTFVLGISPLAFASADPRWCSYRQAAERGWQVRRGEKATQIYFYKPLEIADPRFPDEGDASKKTIPLLRTFTVFHASQMDGIPEFVPPTMQKPLWRRIEDADLILRNSGVPVRIGGDRAFFSPATDHIQLPPDEVFHSQECWAATVMHELAHASGATHRLNRDMTGRFGSRAYSQEELRAELASVFLGSMIGLPSDIPNHASYINSWIVALKNDKREIFHAAADAQKIADYLLSFHPEFAEASDDGLDGDQPADAGAAAAAAMAA